jgi:hypothetical protein
MSSVRARYCDPLALFFSSGPACLAVTLLASPTAARPRDPARPTPDRVQRATGRAPLRGLRRSAPRAKNSSSRPHAPQVTLLHRHRPAAHSGAFRASHTYRKSPKSRRDRTKLHPGAPHGAGSSPPPRTLQNPNFSGFFVRDQASVGRGWDVFGTGLSAAEAGRARRREVVPHADCGRPDVPSSRVAHGNHFAFHPRPRRPRKDPCARQVER